MVIDCRNTLYDKKETTILMIVAFIGGIILGFAIGVYI